MQASAPTKKRRLKQPPLTACGGAPLQGSLYAILFSFCFLDILPRSLVILGLKGAVKVGVIAKAAVLAHLIRRYAARQQLLGVHQALLLNIAVYRGAHLGIKFAQQVVFADEKLLSQLVQGQALAVVLIYIM